MRRSILDGATVGPAEDWVEVARARVARRGGALHLDGGVARLTGFGPDMGLDHAWIRSACDVPLILPRETLADLARGPREVLDARLDDWIRLHREEVRTSVMALVGETPRVRPTEAAVRAAVVDDPPLEASRAAHEAAATSTHIAFLQLREIPSLVLDVVGISSEARAVLARAIRQAAAPAPDLEVLAARRVAIVREALAALEAMHDDPDMLAVAAADTLMPLAERFVEEDALAELLDHPA